MDQDRRPVDLHMHSSVSDGVLSPFRLIELAARAGLAAAGLTDHDTVDGVGPALEAGSVYGIEVVPGLEVSAHWKGVEVHILGYYPACSKKLDAVLQGLREERYRRMEAILTKLRRLGLELELDEVTAEAGPSAPGRLHLARILVRKGLTKNLEQAFGRYLGKGRPAYVPRTALTPARAIQVLLDAGAVPVLAHPGWSGRGLLKYLVPFGLQGVEVFHPDHPLDVQRQYYREAVERGLLVTGGSDFHGDLNSRSGRPGCITIPYLYLAKLKEALSRR